MLNANPVKPVWGPMCLWDPGYGRFQGGWGRFVGWGPDLSVRDSTNEETGSAVTRRRRGVFRNLLAHQNRVRVAQISYGDDVGQCLGFFLAICDLLVLGVPGTKRNFAAARGPKQAKNTKKWISQVLGATKCRPLNADPVSPV